MYPKNEKDNYNLLLSPYSERNKLSPIGEYRIGRIEDNNFISFSLHKKPHPFHRLMCRWFFGLRWIDYKKQKIGN